MKTIYTLLGCFAILFTGLVFRVYFTLQLFILVVCGVIALMWFVLPKKRYDD